MYKTSEIRVRDPYVVVSNGAYYLYKSDLENEIIVFKSYDLENWEEPKTVYTIPENSWAEMDLWAPEVHYYKGKYYMFLSLMGKNGKRGTEISVSDTPDGRFTPIVNGPATPSERSCIDGTVYIEGDTPYMGYSADWPDNYNEEQDCYIGEIWAVQLTEDLKERVGSPFMLFRSGLSLCSKEPNIMEWNGKQIKRYGSDAPFITKLSDGTLYLTWSPFPGDTYIVAAAVAKSIKDEWVHLDKPLFGDNGGHAMFFDDLNGNKKLCIHWPERWFDERARFIDVKEVNGTLEII